MNPTLRKIGMYVGAPLCAMALMSGKLNWLMPWICVISFAIIMLWVMRDAQVLPPKIARWVDIRGHAAVGKKEVDKAGQKAKEAISIRRRRNFSVESIMASIEASGTALAGQSWALRTMLKGVEGHIAKEVWIRPYVGCILGLPGTGKSTLIQQVSDALANASGSPCTVTKYSLTAEGGLDVAALANVEGGILELEGVSLMLRSRKGSREANDLLRFLKGELPRKAGDLIVLMTESVTKDEVGPCWVPNEDAPEEERDYLTKLKPLVPSEPKIREIFKACYPDDFWKVIDTQIVLAPYTSESAVYAIWSLIKSVILKEYNIQVEDATREQISAFFKWLAPYAKRVVIQTASVDEVKSEVLANLSGMLVQARKNGISNVIPQFDGTEMYFSDATNGQVLLAD